MHMDILTAQDGPVVQTINGKEYTFPLWRTRDIIPVLARIKAQRIESLKSKLTQEKVAPQTAAYMLYEEENKRLLTPYDAHDYFQTAEGVDECLTNSLKRSGVAPDEAQNVVDLMKYESKAVLAAKIAGVVEVRQQPTFASQAKQNDGTGFGDQKQAPEQPQGFGDAPNPTNPAT